MGEILQDYSEVYLSDAQAALKNLADEMLALRPENDTWTNITFTVNASPDEVEQQLKSSPFASLMLAEGESLLSPYLYDGHTPKIDLIIGEVQPVQIAVRAWGWDWTPEHESVRRVNDPNEIGHYVRQIDARVTYRHEDDDVSEATQNFSVSLHADTGKGASHNLSRDVYAPAYADMGYEGHNQATINNPSEEDLLASVEFLKKLFELRVK